MIDINNFNGGSIIQNGKFDEVIINIKQLPNSDAEKSMQLFSCLSQAHNTPGPFQSECTSAFEKQIYKMAKVSINDVVLVRNSDGFIGNFRIENVAKKIDYLAKQRFFNGCCGFRGTKFSHHLSRIFKSSNSSSAGAGLGLVLAGSLSFAYNGLVQLVSGTTDDQKKLGIAVPAIVVGAGLCIAPLVEAYEKSGTEDPE